MGTHILHLQRGLQSIPCSKPAKQHFVSRAENLEHLVQDHKEAPRDPEEKQ